MPLDRTPRATMGPGPSDIFEWIRHVPLQRILGSITLLVKIFEGNEVIGARRVGEAGRNAGGRIHEAVEFWVRVLEDINFTVPPFGELLKNGCEKKGMGGWVG
jgi:hypothetical protein